MFLYENNNKNIAASSVELIAPIETIALQNSIYVNQIISLTCNLFDINVFFICCCGKIEMKW